MSANLSALAASIAHAIKVRSGLTVPASVILSHFHAEGTASGNNYAGLMQNGKLIDFPSSSAFATEYVNTVVPHLVGGLQQGFYPSGSTLNAGQYAGALQYGTNHAYCTSQCGTFYQVKPPNTSILSKLGITWLGFNNPGTAFGQGTQPLSNVPGGGTNVPGAVNQALGGTMPWWETGLILAALLALIVVVVAKSVGSSPVEIVSKVATGGLA